MCADRLVEQQSSVADNGRRRDEMLHALELAHKEQERLTDAEHGRLNARLMELADEASRKITVSEMKQREENSEKFTIMERVFRNCCIFINQISFKENNIFCIPTSDFL